MRCHACGAEMTCRLGDHHYTESGLDSVFLADVELWECPCGEKAVGIPAVPELHRVIGEALARKPALLGGPEIRFLRKNLGLASKDFADLLGVDKATVSRWENGKQVPDRPTDRFIRLVYAAHKGISLESLLERFPTLSAEQEPSRPLKLPRSFWSRGEVGSVACQHSELERPNELPDAQSHLELAVIARTGEQTAFLLFANGVRSSGREFVTGRLPRRISRDVHRNAR